MKTIDRYLLRECLVPFALSLVVFTFVLVIPPVIDFGEQFIIKGVGPADIAWLLALLLPQALCLTIPMAVLMSILVGFGRVAADREFVALQACGVSLYRLLRPVAVIALAGTAATAYQTIVATPYANQTFREAVFELTANRVESNVRPRVFFDDFPQQTIYVRDVPPEGGWRDVFFGENRPSGDTVVHFAREGRIAIDREKRLVQLRLVDGTTHQTPLSNPEAYESTSFEQTTITLDANAVFPSPPAKGVPEMTFAELDAVIAEAAGRGDPAFLPRFQYQLKLALPATCPILALIALALAASNRKDGKFASFALGFAVVMIYYVLLYFARSMSIGGQLNPDWGPWAPNLILAAAAVALVVWRDRWSEQSLRISLPRWWRRAQNASAPPRPGLARVVVVVRLPRLNIPVPRILDTYITREYVRVLALSVVSLLGIFYISTFIDLADKLFRGEATTALLLRYFFFQTPQFVYFVVPIGVLMATLVAIGVLTKNSELIVMRACGISLYRAVVPVVLGGIVAGSFLFLLQERVLASVNYEADRLNRQIRGWPPRPSNANRRWVVGANGDMYRFDVFDTRRTAFSRLWVYHIDQESWRLRAMTYAEDTTPAPVAGDETTSADWLARRGWFREVSRSPAAHGALDVKYVPFESRRLTLDRPAYFTEEVPDPEMMTIAELDTYIEQLQRGGAHAARYQVARQRKYAFPLVTVIMTLLAIPFAVTTGRRGALYGVGIGIALAITYWIAQTLFGAIGEAGLLGPVIAAWAPNILFGAAAVYLILAVRT
jgi:LPS export ABC transporter permease LptG/LPS export ABC transporter permease LptF